MLIDTDKPMFYFKLRLPQFALKYRLYPLVSPFFLLTYQKSFTKRSLKHTRHATFYCKQIIIIVYKLFSF
jgi:hypothetical protein